jgi:hypothetical protein
MLLYAFLKERNIENLMHFSRARNLKNLIRYGILPIEELRNRNVETVINDDKRLDFCTSASSVSIEFPNYKMLYKLRMADQNEDWIIIRLKSDVIIEKKCAFCFDNASKENISDIPIEERSKLDMLKKMFADIEGYPTRKERKLRRFYTTLPQAEVLVFGTIEIKYFESIIFKDEKTMNRHRNGLFGNIKCEIIPDYFYARNDSAYWN